MCKGSNDWVACFEAVRPKFSHTSYKQPQKPESQSVFRVKAYKKIFLTQNSAINQQDKLKVQKALTFPLPSFFLLSFRLFNETAAVSYEISFEIMRRKLARLRSKLIPSRMPHV